jgi:hypothetical protein
MPNETREIVTKLRFETDGSGKRIFDDLARSGSNAANQGGYTGGSYQPPAQGGGGHKGGGGGGGSPFGGAVSQIPGLGQFSNILSAGGGAAAAYKFANYTASYARNSDNPFLSDGERERMNTRNSLLGETYQNWKDSMVGRERQTLLAKANSERLQQYSNIHAQQAGTMQGLAGEISASQSRYDAARGASPVAFNPGDRSTVAGSIRYREELQILGLKDKQAEATRQATAARKQEADSAGRLVGFQREVEALDRRKKDLFDQFNKAEGPEKARLGGLLEATGLDLNAANQRARTEAERRRALGIAAAEAEGAAGRAGLDVRREQLGVLVQRENTASSQATNLGLMGPAARARAKFALQYIQQHGIDNVPPELIAAARSVAPETVGKIAENAGQKHVEDFRKLAPDEFRDNVPGIRGEVDKARQGIREDELKLVADEARKVNQATKDILAIMSTFSTELAQVRVDVETKFRQNNGVK